MNKTYLMSVAAVFVLSAGLISCSPEEKAKDIYKAKPPTIVVDGGKLDLKSFEQLSNKTLDLNDRIDFSESQPVQTRIESFCHSETGKDFQQTFTLSGAEPIKLFQIVPEGVLLTDLGSQPALCNFEVQLTNAAGSKNISHILSVSVVETSAPEVWLGLDGEPALLSTRVLRPRDVEGLRLRFRNRSQAAARIECEDISYPPLPFEQVLELSHFNLSRSEVNAPLLLNPRQGCRAMIAAQGTLQAISARFIFIPPRPPLQIEVVQVPLSPRAALAATMKTVKQTKYVHFASINIHNSDNVARLIAVPKRASLTFHYAFQSAKTSTTGFSSRTSPAIFRSELSPINETEEHQIFALEAGTQLRLVVSGLLHLPHPCHQAGNILRSGLIVDPPAASGLFEVDRDGEQVDELQLSWQRHFLWPRKHNFTAKTKIDFSQQIPVCHWY